MNKQESQYYAYLKNLGYSPVFNQEKSSFLLKDQKIYLKCCSFPASQEVKDLAIMHSDKYTIILLDGNLTFRDYSIYVEGEESSGGFLTAKNSKYSPIFYGEFETEYFQNETLAIAKAIDQAVLTCRCGKKDQYIVTKNIHYKATCVCGNFIKNLSTNKPITIHFGKYAGRELESMTSKEEVQYLQWAINSGVFSKKVAQAAIEFLK